MSADHLWSVGDGVGGAFLPGSEEPMGGGARATRAAHAYQLSCHQPAETVTGGRGQGIGQETATWMHKIWNEISRLEFS